MNSGTYTPLGSRTRLILRMVDVTRKNKVAARIVPFGVYVLFLLASQAVGWVPVLTESLRLWIYPVKTLAVAAALLYYWRQYEDLPWPPKLSLPSLALAVATGMFVYIAWVHMDWS